MKKSEVLEERLNLLKAERADVYDKMVKSRLDEDEANREVLWNEYWHLYGKDFRDEEDELVEAIRIEKNRELDVDDGATVCYWTDRHACTVIRKTKKMIVLRRDKAVKANGFKPEYIPGGFGVHCINNEAQQWEYEPDEAGQIYRACWSEKKGCYMADKGTLKVIPGRHEFYDYNF